jgi:predicted DNA-binding transcriptional regulator AlpA
MHYISSQNQADRLGLPEPLLTRRELAKLCKVSTRTVDNWVANKRIPVLRGPSERCVRFSWSEVVKSLRSAEEGSCK